VLTYDELLERARFLVSKAATAATAARSGVLTDQPNAKEGDGEPPAEGLDDVPF
jgi:hypothetical protein